jgi:hypothetical protein
MLQKVEPEPQLDLLNAKYINAWGEALFQLPLNAKQRQAIRNYTESAHRIAKKRVQMTTAAGAWKPQVPPLVFPTEEAQHIIYDLYESYYQSVYNTLSKLAGVVVLFPEVFGHPPVRSMEKFLKHFAALDPEFEEACAMLERARKYRTLLDHPAGAPVTDWMTFRGADDRGIVVFHFGDASRKGTIPEGTEPSPDGFPRSADWYVDPPFVPHVDAALAELMGRLFTQIQQFDPARATGTAD